MGDASNGQPAGAAGSVKLGGERPINRMGYGAMRITGEGIWGDHPDPERCKEVLRSAVELGVNFIDTADAYGPETSENLIADALHPYPDDLMIGTKGGLTRPGPGEWGVDARPERLKECCEGSLKRLKVDSLPLYQLHAVDGNVPIDESVGAIAELKEEGKVRQVGLCNVGADQLAAAQDVVEIVSVQNRYSFSDRDSEPLVEACQKDGLAFFPWFPLGAGEHTKPGGTLDQIAERQGATRSQVALAWLLGHSPIMVPIPGTSSEDHLRENVESARVELTDEDRATLAS